VLGSDDFLIRERSWRDTSAPATREGRSMHRHLWVIWFLGLAACSGEHSAQDAVMRDAAAKADPSPPAPLTEAAGKSGSDAKKPASASPEDDDAGKPPHGPGAGAMGDKTKPGTKPPGDDGMKPPPPDAGMKPPPPDDGMKPPPHMPGDMMPPPPPHDPMMKPKPHDRPDDRDAGPRDPMDGKP
jgi:hypothetical protein